MFCDLVSSTSLAEQLTPVNYLRVLQSYQQACTEVIKPWGGHIAQYLGDGILVYFGYPQTSLDHIYRAVQAGSQIIAAIQQLNTTLIEDLGIELAVRIGVSCGDAIMAQIDINCNQGNLAVGLVVNIASRLQNLAVPNSVIICSTAYQKYMEYLQFHFQHLGKKNLKGISQPLDVYQVSHPVVNPLVQIV